MFTVPVVISVKIKHCIVATIVAVLVIIVMLCLTLQSNEEGRAITKGDETSARKKLPPIVIEYEPSASESTHPHHHRRIVFHDTSGNNYLGTKQTCAVESAAKNNPNRTVQLFMHDAEKPHDCSPWYRVLANYPNIQIVLVDSSRFFTGTPLEKWSAAFSQPHQHQQFVVDDIQYQDAVRFLSLYNGGGFSLDFDFIVLKPFQAWMEDFVVFGDDERNNTGFTHSVLHTKAKHPLLAELLAQLANTKHNDSRRLLNSNDNLLTRVMRQFCDYSESRNFNSSSSCSDIKLLPSRYFIPIEEKDLASIYYYNINFDDVLAKMRDSFALRTWGKLARRYPVTFDMEQTFSLVAAQHCPFTVSVASEDAR